MKKTTSRLPTCALLLHLTMFHANIHTITTARTERGIVRLDVDALEEDVDALEDVGALEEDVDALGED